MPRRKIIRMTVSRYTYGPVNLWMRHVARVIQPELVSRWEWHCHWSLVTSVSTEECAVVKEVIREPGFVKLINLRLSRLSSIAPLSLVTYNYSVYYTALRYVCRIFVVSYS